MPKCLFLTVFTTTYHLLTKVNVLGTSEVSIWFKNVVLLFCFILGYPKLTPYVRKMASKLMSSYLTSNSHKLPCPLVAVFKTFPAVS